MKIKRKTFWGGIIAALCACTALTFGAVYSTNNNVDASAATGQNPKDKIQLTYKGYYHEDNTSTSASVASLTPFDDTHSLGYSNGPATNEANTSVTYSQSTAYKNAKFLYIDVKVNVPVPAWEEWDISYSLGFTLKASNNSDGGYNQSVGAYYFYPTTTTFDENYQNTTQGNSSSLSLAFATAPTSTTNIYCNGLQKKGTSIVHSPTLHSSATDPTTKSTLTLSNKSDEEKTFTFSYGMSVALSTSTSRNSNITACNANLTADDVTVRELSVPVPSSDLSYNYDGTDKTSAVETDIQNSNWYTKDGASWYTPGSWATYHLPTGGIKDVIKTQDGGIGSYEVTYSLTDIYPFKKADGTFTTAPQTLKVTINPKPLLTPNGTVTVTYNGLEYTLFDLPEDRQPGWYDSDIYLNSSIIEMDDSVIDAGDHTITVTLKSANYVWSNRASNPSDARTFTFKVNKKPLETYFVDENGLKVARFSNESEIYNRDSGAKYPRLVTRYSRNNNPNNANLTSPNNTGTWYAFAFLENAESCNYSVASTGEQFELNKIGVAYPTLVGSASAEYDGEEHEFTFEGFDPELMTCTVPIGADSFDGEILKVKNAGTYTPEFRLINDALYTFTGTAPSVEVTPKTATLSASADGGAWSWERRTTKEVEITVSGVVTDDLPNLTINAKYTKDEVSRTIGVATHVAGYRYKITIPSISQIAAYTLTLTLADGGNYALATPFTQTFNITGTVPPFDEQYIVWQYTVDGRRTQLNDFVYDGDVVLLEFTGSEYTFSIDETELQQYGLKVKTDGYQGQSATNVKTADNGIYTMTVTIEAIDENTVFADTSYTLQFKIVPKVLDFSDAEWEWQYVGDGDSWNAYNANSKPSWTGSAVSVRISPAYMASLGLAAGDYTESFIHSATLTDQGAKTTTSTLTISNGNYTTASGNIATARLDWEITAQALTYSWSGTQTVNVGINTFEFPAVVFADGNDYSQYYEYVYTVDGVDGAEFTLEELKAYIVDSNWSETSPPVSGNVSVRLNSGVTEYTINSIPYPFTTGTPKTVINIAVTGSGAEYGKVNFAISILRGTANADESRRTSVTITGDTLEGAQTFDGDDTELIKFMNKLGAGSYTITVSLKADSEDSYVLSQREFEFEVCKQNVLLPTVREIVFTGETINLIDYLDGFDPALMKLIGAAEGENGIVSGRDYRKSGYFTTIALIDGANYQFVKTADSGAEAVSAKVKFAVALADGDEVIGSEYEINWMINRFRITEEMWDKSGKHGVTLKLPAQFAAMLADENLLKVTFSYYDDQNGAALEEFSFKGGNSFWTSATLTGEEANNFEFENGMQISDKTVYTVPQSKTEAFFNNTMTFVKNNLYLVIGCAAGLLLLILLIIIIACAARSRRKKREREEQRRLEEKEERKREQEERRLEREERMARMSQQMMMPQMMPQGMPQMGGQPMTAGGYTGGGSSGGVSEAQFQQMQAELAELKAEKVAKEAAQQQIAQAKADVQFAGFMAQLMGGGSIDKLTEIIRAEVRNALADERTVQSPAEHKEEAKEITPVCPPDAVMTTVTTTKIDTTKKPQTAERAAAQPAPARTVVRNLVAPMPVDDGRVFDVGGFYTPADPVADLGSGEEDKD